MIAVLSVGAGAFLGACLRWLLGIQFNALLPTLPLGTLCANLSGSLLMGCMLFLTTEHAFFSYEARLGIITGFLGSFTTFSTFSAEALHLFAKQEFLWLCLLILAHVAGSLLMVAAGYTLAKFIFQSAGGVH